MESLHKIPQIPNTIHDDDRQKHRVLYDLAKHHTNEEIFIGLTALKSSFSIRDIDQIFDEVRQAIRSVAQVQRRSEDDVTKDLLEAQSRNGVHLRNRAQTKADRFGRIKRKVASGASHRAIAWTIRSQGGFVQVRKPDDVSIRTKEKTTGDLAVAKAKEGSIAESSVVEGRAASIRDQMSLKNILN